MRKAFLGGLIMTLDGISTIQAYSYLKLNSFKL